MYCSSFHVGLVSAAFSGLSVVHLLLDVVHGRGIVRRLCLDALLAGPEFLRRVLEPSPAAAAVERGVGIPEIITFFNYIFNRLTITRYRFNLTHILDLTGYPVNR